MARLGNKLYRTTLSEIILGFLGSLFRLKLTPTAKAGVVAEPIIQKRDAPRSWRGAPIARMAFSNCLHSSPSGCFCFFRIVDGHFRVSIVEKCEITFIFRQNTCRLTIACSSAHGMCISHAGCYFIMLLPDAFTHARLGRSPPARRALLMGKRILGRFLSLLKYSVF